MKKFSILFFFLFNTVFAQVEYPIGFTSLIKESTNNTISIDNPINIVLLHEYEVNGQLRVEKVYKILAGLLLEAKKMKEEDRLITKLIKLNGLLSNKFHLKVTGQQVLLISDAIGRNERDCDIGSYFLKAVAYEMGWEVFAIPAPNHLFLQVKDKGKLTNFETTTGTSEKDEYYTKWLKITPKALQQKVYLRPLTEEEYIGLFYNILADAKSNQKQHQKAMNFYEISIQKYPKNPVVYYNRAVTKIELQNYQSAIQDLEYSLKLDEKYADALYNQGIAYNRLEQYNLALEKFNKALENKDTVASYYVGRANAYFNLGNTQKAIQDCDKAIQIKPKYSNAYYNKGAFYMQLKQNSKALQAYTKAIEYDKDNYSAYYNRALVYLKQNQLAQAEKDLNNVIRLNKKYYIALYWRGYIKEKQSRFEEALIDYKDLLEIKEDDIETHYRMAIVYKKQLEFAKAIGAFKQVLKYKKDEADAAFFIGYLYNQKKEYDNAIEYFNIAIQAKEEARSFLGRGFAYIQQEKPEKAFEDFNSAVKLDKTSADAYFNRGLMQLYLKKDENAAIADFKKAIQLKPEFKQNIPDTLKSKVF